MVLVFSIFVDQTTTTAQSTSKNRMECAVHAFNQQMSIEMKERKKKH